MDELKFLLLAQTDFEKHFGLCESITAKFEVHGGEKVVVVENRVKRAFYSCPQRPASLAVSAAQGAALAGLNIELIKVFNLQGE